MPFHFVAAITICSDFGAKKIKSAAVSTVSPSLCHEVMGDFVIPGESETVVLHSRNLSPGPQESQGN